jgi:hypothetical protein
MTNLLTPETFPAIRAALDVSLDKATLPDAIIQEDIYIGAAWSDVLGRYSTADTETDEAILARLRRAAIFYAAARLAPAVVRITAMTTNVQGISYSRPTFKALAERAAELRGLAEGEIDLVIEPDGLSRPRMFTVARGRRGL